MPKSIEATLTEVLQKQGYRIQRNRGVPQDQTVVLRESVKPGEKLKVALISDEHLCSKYQQLSHLREFFKYADSRGVEAYISGGDSVDGGRMHRDQEFELFVHGATAQVDYAVEHYPRSENGLVHRIDGNHDYSHYNQAGHVFGAELASKRPDVRFLGYASATVKIGPLNIFVMHGDGGVPYTKSYKMQRIAEQQDLDKRGAHIFVLGHYHTSVHLPRYRGVNCVQMPCWQAQTPYLKRKGLLPEIGGVILEIEFGQGRIRDVTVDWRFYEPKRNDY